MEKIALIAGNRKFPLIYAENARKRGIPITGIAIKGDTSRLLGKYVEKIYWLGLEDFSRMFEIFKIEGIKKAVMCGQISPARLFKKEARLDPQLRQLLENIVDCRADTVFRAIADKISQAGVELLDSTALLEEYMPKKGTLSASVPEQITLKDINFGLDMAKKIASHDIGQTVAVKNMAVVAVEALEGTDNLIKRAGRIVRGVVIVKVSKPSQDKRFDVPVIGAKTIKSLIKAGASGIVIEAEKTLFIDRQISLKLADQKGIFVVAV